MSPESAVTLVAQRGGSKVSAAPRLFAVAPRDGLPQNARWLTVLSPAGHYRGAKTGVRTASEVFAGSKQLYPYTEPRRWIALPEQHPSLTVDVYPTPNPGETSAAYQVRSAHPEQKTLLLKPGYVFEYEEASEVARR